MRILDFETTWSEFQKPSLTAATQGEADLRLYNLEKTSPPQSRSQAVVCVSTPRMYPSSGYFQVMNIFKPGFFTSEKVKIIFSAPSTLMILMQHFIAIKWIFAIEIECAPRIT